jgi:hypothetical protein
MNTEALGLCWALTWRWTLLGVLFLVPLYVLQTVPHSQSMAWAYEIADLLLMLCAFYLATNWVLTKGYGNKRVYVVQKQRED